LKIGIFHTAQTGKMATSFDSGLRSCLTFRGGSMKSFKLLTLLLIVGLVIVSCKKEGTQAKQAPVAQDSIEWNKKMTKQIVHSASQMIQEIIKNNPDEAKVIEVIRKAIDSVRFYDDKSGYFYIYDENCVNIAHAMQKDLQGQDLTNYKDSKGKFVIKELADMAKKGGGFVEFYWRKPGDSTHEVRKMGYVEPVVGTKYFIGSGVYME
jgi:signal transduction histidine kinase